MPNPPAFQMYAQDFDMDTASWSNDEVGIYIRLLNYEWVNGGLPNDIQGLARIVREKKTKFEQKWIKNVSKKFQENGHGMLVNRRMEEVRQNRLKYIKSQSESGLRGVESKKRNHIFPFNKSSDPSSDPSSENQALLSSSSSSLNNKKSKEIARSPKKVNRAVSLADDDFFSILKKNPAYEGIDIDREMGKLDSWLLIPRNKDKKKTKQRVVNWLNRVERPMASQETPPTDKVDREIWEIKQARKKEKEENEY